MNKLGWVFSILLFASTSSERAPISQASGIPMARTFYNTTPGSHDYVIDFTSDPVVDELLREGRLFEDGIFSKVLVKMVYSSKTNRVYAQAGVSYQEDDDPVDNSSTRTPP